MCSNKSRFLKIVRSHETQQKCNVLCKSQRSISHHQSTTLLWQRLKKRSDALIQGSTNRWAQGCVNAAGKLRQLAEPASLRCRKTMVSFSPFFSRDVKYLIVGQSRGSQTMNYYRHADVVIQSKAQT